ncbi:uncharacterized protein LOC135132945 [Zophobas morio]|uniref:uncharacterized protein LOC135132945 n=1 Tax=Zophobas morio TaxID=2755281 RepID=UPI0030827FD1
MTSYSKFTENSLSDYVAVYIIDFENPRRFRALRVRNAPKQGRNRVHANAKCGSELSVVVRFSPAVRFCFRCCGKYASVVQRVTLKASSRSRSENPAETCAVPAFQDDFSGDQRPEGELQDRLQRDPRPAAPPAALRAHELDVHFRGMVAGLQAR